MTLDTLYDTEVDEESSHASIHLFTRSGVPLTIKSGIVVPRDKIGEAVVFLKKQTSVGVIQVYIHKNVLRASVECEADGNTHYMWDDLLITHCRSGTGAWTETLTSEDIERQCPGAVQPEERTRKYKQMLHERHMEQQRIRAALVQGVMASGAPPPEEGEPN